MCVPRGQCQLLSIILVCCCFLQESSLCTVLQINYTGIFLFMKHYL